ncbi:tRNA (guanosine(46)-N7)-methyltransferase TrmB [Marinoscillum furvescens]|uniref:tRNA (guanine-N(7)-)-methyltransferase n=1 Tax=Marinoscillum furvescens DSM 4134 TaxID=1122208 RepID=A0A3D9KYP8_MARFU|nr:tRNA (guanosine(46)-N7)-methyltransferase TrmB [Marinoscillum furvescens]RED94921.1 tRNA (guanine-N(7)-)-methyltransferase [Marinoscillum furvescens DSM 4134]
MRQKLKRFAENARRANIIEPGKPLFEEIKGQWNQLYFKNERPITVELGCGNGEYTVGLAEVDPQSNYIGVDLKGDRLYQGSTHAIEHKLANVGFLRTQIHQLDKFFAPGEVDEFWLTFPDPRPKKREIRRRLSNPRFLKLYQQACKARGWFKFKTDNTPLFEYTLEVLQDEFPVDDLVYTFDLYASDLQGDHHGIKTRYEGIWTEKGERIKYLKFRFKTTEELKELGILEEEKQITEE